MKSHAHSAALLVVVSIMQLEAADPKRPSLAGLTVIEELGSHQQFISNVANLPLRGSKVDELEASLKDASAVLCSTSFPETNRLAAAQSVLADFALLEGGLCATARMTNIFVLPPRGLIAPSGASPSQQADPHQSNLLATFYAARRADRENRALHSRLENLHASYRRKDLEELISFGGTSKFSNQFREFVLLSATNDFTITLSNRLFAPK